jgi:hypothetical protein
VDSGYFTQLAIDFSDIRILEHASFYRNGDSDLMVI